MSVTDLAYRGVSIPGFRPTAAPDPGCCSDPAVLCPRCALAALERAGTVHNELVVNSTRPEPLPWHGPPVPEDPPPVANIDASGHRLLPMPGDYRPRVTDRKTPTQQDSRGPQPMPLPQDYV